VSHLTGVPAAELADEDLLRELRHLHETRHETFLHGPREALDVHTRRTGELEGEFLRRHPDREVDAGRMRAGSRSRAGQQ
jgi:hypothetical protein